MSVKANSHVKIPLLLLDPGHAFFAILLAPGIESTMILFRI